MDMLNVLLVTVDDMNYDSLGCMGCNAPDITPRIDALAAEGTLLENAYVAIAVCQPSRSVLLTGRYPHKNGARGFEEIDYCVTTLTERLREQGYYNGIIGKVDHVTPREKFAWDHVVKTLSPEENWGRDPEKMYEHTRKFIREAGEQGRPFFLMANSHDPHRPFAGSEFETPKYLAASGKGVTAPPEAGEYFRGKYVRSPRYYSPSEVEVPGHLPDLPDVRREIADYSSVHRADAAVGRVLDALEDEGHAKDTLVMFLSDNGAAFPFAKTNCYMNGTRCPFILRLPNVIPAGVRFPVLVSSIDYVPTVLDFLGIPQIDGVDGKSMKPLLLGRTTEHYDTVYTMFFKTSRNFATGKVRHFPMRCVQSRKYSYIYNEWAGGPEEFRNESMSGLTFAAMKSAAESDETIRERVELLLHRVPEELYDLESDPSCLHNLVSDPSAEAILREYRERMCKYMEDSQDALLARYKSAVLHRSGE